MLTLARENGAGACNTNIPWWNAFSGAINCRASGAPGGEWANEKHYGRNITLKGYVNHLLSRVQNLLNPKYANSGLSRFALVRAQGERMFLLFPRVSTCSPLNVDHYKCYRMFP